MMSLYQWCPLIHLRFNNKLSLHGASDHEAYYVFLLYTERKARTAMQKLTNVLTLVLVSAEIGQRYFLCAAHGTLGSTALYNKLEYDR